MATTINRLREKIALARLRLNWRWLQLRAAFYRQDRSAAPSLVLVPCEPWSVIGSRGDEAMTYSILRDFRRRHPEGRITIITGSLGFADTPDGQRLARDFDARFAYAWRPRLFLSNIVRAYKEAQATEVHVLGADCMDGHWSSYLSIILLASADIAARMGISTCLTAFSWNEHPCLEVVKAFKNVTPKLPILVRDPMSYERFVQDVCLKKGHAAALVADIAFNLKPRITPLVQTELDWMAEQRAAGHFVLGFNLHAMLVNKARLPSLIEATIMQLRDFMAAHPQVALALVPHDYREGGDAEVLKQIAEALASEGARVRLVTPIFSAEELKALTGGLDALFTSRMHLGIAALGMGRPVAAFAYQGKFAGLFRHVDLPEELILSPENADGLAKTLGALVRDVAALTQTVAKALPATMDLAKKNLLS